MFKLWILGIFFSDFLLLVQYLSDLSTQFFGIIIFFLFFSFALNIPSLIFFYLSFLLLTLLRIKKYESTLIYLSVVLGTVFNYFIINSWSSCVFQSEGKNLSPNEITLLLFLLGNSFAFIILKKQINSISFQA